MKLGLFANLLVGTLLIGATSAARTQSTEYPNRPVRIIVPFAAGAGTDLLARVIAQKLQERLGQPFLVENKAGAGGNIGAEFVAKSPNDGYTLLLAQNGLTTIPYLLKAAPFDAIRDFAPVGILAELPVIFAVPTTVPAKTINEFVAYAKENPGKLSYASAGIGSPQHLLAELFLSMTGTRIVHIPYKGGIAPLNAMVAGEVQFTLISMGTALPFVTSGKVRALGVGGRRRHPTMTDLPAIDESVPGYEAVFWYGVVAPAGTPVAIINKLSDEQRAALKLPDVRERLRAFDFVGGTAEEMRKTMLTDYERWGKVVKFSGLKAE
ncbi:MAG: tripartite tricarboxylate transporter substrate binding protein [Betaproteobacteria bacterium]|nr:tripartite tricarboxylate transporter substrate binding protein [Betaproteobacteria bacterium]